MLGGKKILIIVGIILLGTILFRIKTNTMAEQSAIITESTVPIVTAPAFESKTASLGAVTVEVTPEKLGTSEGQNVLEIKFNTHSVNLDFDFTKIFILTDNLGNTYKALTWNGGQGGHHLSGKIVFPKITPPAQSVILKISMDGQEASLRWEF